MDRTAGLLYRFRFQFILIQSFFLLIMWLLLGDTNVMSQASYVRLYSIWNILSFVFLFYKELKLSDGLQPIVFIALITVQFIGINGLDLSSRLYDGEAIYLVSSNVTPYLGKSVWFLSLEHILIISGYYIVDYKCRRHPLPKVISLIKKTNIDYTKWALRLYVFIWGLRIIDFIIPLTSLTSVIASFANRGQMVVLTLLAYQLLKDRTPRIERIYWCITIVEIFLVLNHGMKEEILINLVPYAIYLLIGYKGGVFPLSTKLVTKIVVLGVVTIYGVFPYVAIFRSISEKKHIPWSEVEVNEALSKYGDYILKEGEFKDSDSGEMSTDYFMSRAGSIACNAWSIHYAETHEPVYRYLYYGFARSIPRFLWPDKPPNVIGNMMYELAAGNSNWEQKALRNGMGEVSITIGFIGGIYFSLGLWAAICAPMLIGMFICWYWRELEPMISYNIVAIWAMYGLIMMLLKDFESLVDGGINFCIISMFYVFVFRKAFPMTKYYNQKQ